MSDHDIAELEARIERLEAQNEALAAENERLDRELTEYKQENEHDKASIRQNIHELVEVKATDQRPTLEDIWIAGQPLGKIIEGLNRRVNQNDCDHHDSDDGGGGDGGDGGSGNGPDRDADGRSPLARLIDVPAERAREFLSVNQVRGRKIAQRAREIGSKTPEGLVVRSDEIAEPLRRWGESAHTETVSRVMAFIEQLGGGDVHSTMHKGRRILVFDLDRVKKYGTGGEPTEVRSHRDVIPARTTETDPAPA